MAQFGNPSIVTSGLTFGYDMFNTTKSYKGPPTTNYVTNAATMSSFGNYSNGPTSTFITEFGTTGWRMTSAGSWNGCSQGISIPSTGTYTFSAWYRYWGGSSNNNGATCYVSGWGGGDSAASIDKTKIGIWQRISITLNCTNTSMTFYLISYGGTNNADNSTWEVTMPQVEAGSVATPFVNGTRSTTQSLVDTTGKTSITLNSLTYASNGDASFNGSSNYMTVDSSSNWAFGSNGTVEQWVYISGNSGTNNRFWCTINSSAGLDAYLNGSTYNIYFHGGTVGTTSTIPTGQWVNLAVTYTSGTIAVYFNGVSQSLTGTTTGYNITNTGTLYIGQYSGGGNYYFNGRIPMTRVYNKGLTASEVLQNYNALRGRYGV